MSEFGLVQKDMAAAGEAARDAATKANGADAVDAVGTLATALPGSSTADVMPQFASAWDDGID
ncbi:MAG: hypothetical protein ACRDO4_07120, partial [Nocardioides sp.]